MRMLKIRRRVRDNPFTLRGQRSKGERESTDPIFDFVKPLHKWEDISSGAGQDTEQ